VASKVAIFWPGDYRQVPNGWALPNIERATAQITSALKRLGRPVRLVRGFLARPDQAIRKLGALDEPMIGLFVHWVYGPHTVDGVVGKDHPLLLASNFSGTWPGLVGLLNTAACLASVERPFSRIWTDAQDWSKNKRFMDRLDEWCRTGTIRYPEDELHYSAAVSDSAAKVARGVLADLRRQRPLILMLGDTSMGMINGYFGPRVLSKVGFAEHKVDQAWLIPRTEKISPQRIAAALQFVKAKGVRFHWGETDAEDFDESCTAKQLAMYCAVLDLLAEFRADCLGWQYQLGLIPCLPPSDFAEGLLNSTCRPESNGDVVITATEADQGNVVPMEMMKRLLKARGLHPAVMFHDVRWGGRHNGRFLWVLLNSGSCGAYAFRHDPDSLKGVHSYRQPRGYFPIPGGTFAGESRPGKMTWARAYLKDGQPWMDLGRGEVVKLPPKVRDRWWQSTTPQWPLMVADLGCSMQTLMAHYLSNHVAVAYGDIFGEMVVLSQELGFRVRILSS
jgi:L-fucose isomerase-like protein